MRIVEEILYSLKKNSNLIALKIGNREITYRELDKLSDAALVWLHSKGVRQEASVLIMTKEYQNFIILALAALKGGITYVPIASEMPNERLSSICFYCNTNVIITDFDYQGQNFGIYLQFSESILEFGLSDYTNYYCKPSDDHIIYVIFTSGSTGIPKGVEITSKAISNYLSWARDYYDIGIPLVFPVFTSISFDLSITSMFLPVLTGGTCILLNIEDSYEKLGRLSELEVINTMKLTPSHLMILNEMDLLNMKELKQVIVGGEALKKQVVQQFVSKFNRNIRVINEYGPTEAAVGCMFYEYSMYDKEDIVPIGNPIDNVSLYILDERGNLITGEAEGELFISGDSLAKGYANNPLQTGERFFYDNTLNKMLYKTGDVVRRDNLGKYHYIGRVDRQVKLGGHRIELNEIDFSISQFSKDLSPITIFDSDRNKIITFLKSNIEYSLNNIEKYLKDRLPYYMLPQLVKIDTVPLTINGKIDEKSLLDSLLFQDNEDEELKGDYFETIIYRLFIKTLNRNSFLITQNYFELGGNSIGAMRILSNLNKQISEKITMKDFLKNSSVKELSHLLKSKGNRRNHALNEDNIYFKNELLDLSPNERGIVFKELLNFENNTLWNIPYLWEISAPLDVKRLEFAIYKIIERYDILRTNYVYNDSDFQRNINTTILNNVFEHIVVNSSDNIEKLLLDSVESRTDTQNDLGYLLSGGLDSSLVVSMASRLNDKVDTYTIFYEGNENNTDYFHALQLISENNNISNTVNKVSKENISMKMLKYLSYQMEEVVWDKVYFSMFENYRRSANDHKRIVITGQGSDEVWLGYYHDFPFYSLAEKDVNLDKLCDLFIEMNIKHKDFLTEEAYVIIKKSVYKIIQKILNKRPNDSHLNKVAYWATKTYLISNLMQEDRLSMAMSVETRSPFLNYNLVEAAFSLPDFQKVNNGNEKYILKQVGTGYLPTSITSRQKQAFVNPTSNYDGLISEFLDQHGLEIDTVPFFKYFFSEKFLKNIVQKNIDSELLWKIVGILVFLKGFKGDGNFYYE